MLRRIVVFAVALAASATAALVGAAGPAHSATADRWGFAFVKDPLVPVWTTLDTTRQWGSWKIAFPGLWADGIRLAPGRFLIRFPQVGTGSRGVVHVTPVNRTGHYCEVALRADLQHGSVALGIGARPGRPGTESTKAGGHLDRVTCPQ